MELSKKYYIKNRKDINVAFHMFCKIRELTPTSAEIQQISMHVNVEKLLEFLDNHFKVLSIYSINGKLLKTM